MVFHKPHSKMPEVIHKSKKIVFLYFFWSLKKPFSISEKRAKSRIIISSITVCT